MKREKIIDLPQIIDKRGNLSFVEVGEQIPFNIKRTYWIYDVPGGQERGSHAFREQHELIIALSGSFDVVLDDGSEKRKYTLNRSYKALYVPNMIWRSLDNFSTNSVCLVIASAAYNEDDYIRNHAEFRNELNQELQQSIPLLSPSNTIDRSNQYHTVFDCDLIEFPVIKNRAGNITPVQSSENIPFHVDRVFYIYDIPCGERRGMHAHKYCHEVLIAASGSFEIELDDGTNKKTVKLNRPMSGLHIPPGVWATEKEYSSGAVCLALASSKYDAEGYIKTYSEFEKYRADGNKGL